MSTFAARAGAWLIVVVALALFFGSTPARAFCGFYVGKADASLFNEASQVIMVRRDNRTVISMANDYKGELTDFALVVPVPDRARAQPDPDRRPETVRAHRQLQRAASCRILRSRSLPAAQDRRAQCANAGIASARDGGRAKSAATRRSA